VYYALIMAGGSGTRLWPLSRNQRPKQALKLVDQRTMFQHAVDRLIPMFPPQRILVVTRTEHAALLQEQSLELPAENFIIEPEGRGTAAAIGLAAVHLIARDPKAVMAVLTADHFIADGERFRKSLQAAREAALNGYLVTLGITPLSPSTGYGYIHLGPELQTAGDFRVFRVQEFVEKPELDQAQKMLGCGEYVWNSGMFIWRTHHILSEIARQMPDFYALLSQVSAAIGGADYARVLAQAWPQVVKQTIDFGVMEGAANVAVIPVEFGWTDVGSWSSLHDLLSADENGNILVGAHLDIDTENTLVYGDKRLVATLGVRDLIIVDTEDAILVCPRERGQDVRLLVEQLKLKQFRQWL
jgi:mannose-1-phosphate guanylyltransferase